jgi:hypothetical protein
MTVDISPGFALVRATDPGNEGFYHVQNDALLVSPTFSASHATLPRLDQLVLAVTDTTDGGDASDLASISVIAGTPTSGATLDNRFGAGSLPDSYIPLADVLVGAAASSIVTVNIRSRRAWATGTQTIDVPAGTSSYSIPIDSLVDDLVIVTGTLELTSPSTNIVMRPNGDSSSRQWSVFNTTLVVAGTASSATAGSNSAGLLLAQSSGAVGGAQNAYFDARFVVRALQTGGGSSRPCYSTFYMNNTVASGNNLITSGLAASMFTGVTTPLYSLDILPLAGTMGGKLHVTRLPQTRV